jgi:hypothetical protein
MLSNIAFIIKNVIKYCLKFYYQNNVQQALGRKITCRLNQKSPCNYNNDSC